MTKHRLQSALGSHGLLVALALAGCAGEPCEEFPDSPACQARGGGGSGAGGNGGSATTTGGNGGIGGQGGSLPCGGDCMTPTPFCDETLDMCVACLGDGDCGTVGNAQCLNGSCVPCDSSTQCAHLTNTPVCDNGTCVECKLGEEAKCDSGPTCDLLAKTCTGPVAGTVLNCLACSNDVQCEPSHRCVPMDFAGNPHGHYCLREPPPACNQPFFVFVNKASISGAPATTYCGINEELATCEAVKALEANWFCEAGEEGMCGPSGQPEVPVPGAICRAMGPGGAGGDRCTYACDATQQCFGTSPIDKCGTGNGMPPGWCGGG